MTSHVPIRRLLAAARLCDRDRKKKLAKIQAEYESKIAAIRAKFSSAKLCADKHP